jgi:drug/metabolite transporter, DME family
VLLFTSTPLLWGVAGAVVAGYHSSPGSIAAIAWTAQAVILLGLSWAFGWHRLGSPPAGALLLVALTAAAGTIMYFEALRVAPVAPVTALHLATPILLVSYEIVRRERAPTLRQAVLIGVLLAGVLAAAAGSGGGGAGNRPVLGLALAGASGVTNAILLRAVSASATHAHPNYTSGLVALVAAIVSLPALVLSPPLAGETLSLVTVGVCCWTPAALILWEAGSRLRAPLIGSIGLLEGVVTSAVAWVVFGRHASPLIVAGSIMIIAAIALELRTPPPSVHDAAGADEVGVRCCARHRAPDG